MIDRTLKLPPVQQCQILELARSTAYYQPFPVTARLPHKKWEILYKLVEPLLCLPLIKQVHYVSTCLNPEVQYHQRNQQ